MSDRYKTKAERDDFLETWDIDLHDDDLAGRDLNDYYEEGKPITFEGWKKLIEDLNELFANPPGDCEAVGALSLPESPQVWTIEDVEEVREKMKEMCENHTFDWGWYQPGFEGPDNDLLRFPFGREIIYEIVDQMNWCQCGQDDYSIGEVYPELGTCLQDPPPARTGDTLETLIGGMQVGVEDYKGQWKVYLLRHSTNGDAATEDTRELYSARYPDRIVPWHIGRSRTAVEIARGEIDCSGAVDVGEYGDYLVPDSWLFNYECYLDRDCSWAIGWQVEWCEDQLAQIREREYNHAVVNLTLAQDQGRWDEWVLVATPGIRVHEDCED